MSKKGITRRGFLKGAAASAIGVGMMGSIPVSAEEEMASDSDLLNYDKFMGAKWDFEVAPDPIPEDKIEEEHTAEVIVIGAGTSGLCTAVSCVEQGVDTILFSASEFPVSRGGSNHAV